MNNESDLRQVLVNVRADAVEKFNRAILLIQENNLLEAEKYLRAAIEIDPDVADYYNRLSHLLANQGKTEEALRLILQALAIKPDDAHFLAHHAILLARSGDFGQAETLYRRAIALDGAHVGFHRGLIDALNNQAKHEDAILVARSALALHSDDSALKCQAASLLMRSGELSEAEELLESATLQPSASHAAWNLYSHVLALNKKYEKALAAIEQALALQPNDAHFIAHHGNVLRYLGRIEEAQGLIEQAIQIQPAVAGFHISFSELLEAKGNIDEAISAAQRATECDPANAGYREHLDRLVLCKSRIAEEARNFEEQAPPPVSHQDSDSKPLLNPLVISSLQPPFRPQGQGRPNGFWARIKSFFRKIGF